MARHNNKRPVRREPERKHRINSKIYAKQIRLVGDNVEGGIYPTSKARELADGLDLDLVEINSKAEPPVCKIMDYDKFLYNQKRIEKEQKKSQKKNQLKEIRFGPNTADGDLEHKIKNARKFLEDGMKVKVTVFFKGRTIVHRERGEILLLKFAEDLIDCGLPESLPKLEGKRMNMMLKPKVTK